MTKVQFSFAVLIGFFISGCTGSGFNSVLKNGVSLQDTNAPQVGKDNDSVSAKVPNITGGGQPGAVTLGGVLSSANSKEPKVSSQIRVSQSAGKNAQGKSSDDIREENKLIASPSAIDSSYLNQIESRTDFVQIGCNLANPNVASLIRGLTEAKASPDSTNENLSIKAKLVLICGKTTSSIPYTTVIADQLVMMSATYELVPANGVGFFTALVNKLTLQGSNQFISRGTDSEMVLDGPSLTLSAQRSVDGQGTLDIKTVGGNQQSVGTAKSGEL